MTQAKARVLLIGGSDSGGGAGIQGDLKTVTCLGGYATTAITALTAQNTLGVFGISDVPDSFVADQIKLVLDDIGADTIKTGMLHNKSTIEIVANTIAPFNIPLVLDPVMFAKGGAALLRPDALDTLKNVLIPMAALITPNIPEAEFLADMKIANEDDMRKAADIILKLGCKAVLLKGGHMEGDTLVDILETSENSQRFIQKRIETSHTHGTGCALASAIATGIAQQLPLPEAVARARDYVRKAIELAPNIGKGHGPLEHAHTLAK